MVIIANSSVSVSLPEESKTQKGSGLLQTLPKSGIFGAFLDGFGSLPGEGFKSPGSKLLKLREYVFTLTLPSCI